MQCDVCNWNISGKESAVVVWAVAQRRDAEKHPAAWVHLVHRKRCQKVLEELVWGGAMRVGNEKSVPLVIGLDGFDGTGEKIVCLRRRHAFGAVDLERLRACDRWAAQEVPPGFWRRTKDFVLGAFRP